MKIRIALTMFVCALIAGSALAQQNKVVVIPLLSKGNTTSTPQTEYFTVGSEAFVPGNNVDYKNTYGCGGAFMYSGSGGMVAPVHLPQGAEITNLKVFFNDTSENDMSVSLYRQYLTGCGYQVLASVSSSGDGGYYSEENNSITSPIVDNMTNSYHIYAYSDSWDSDLKIKGAVITYTK